MPNPFSATAAELYPAGRLQLAAKAADQAGLDALLLTPGPDLRYVIGYDAHQLERLTCLAVPAAGDPFLVVPRLELPAAQASPAGGSGLEIIPWDETDDPYQLVAGRLGAVESVGLSDRMWALMVLRFREVLPGGRAGPGLDRAARAAIAQDPGRDRRAARGRGGHRPGARRGAGWLRAGRTELEVAADIAQAITAEGHARADFVIVGSGPNAASPHHEPSSRVLQPGDAVVVDIGGTMPSGYCSDCTRIYAIGQPPAEFTAYYQVLQDAQEAACAAVRPGRPGRAGRRGRPGADHRGRLRRPVHAPHRARHRAGDARGSVHRGGQRRAAGAGHGLLGRAGDLSWPARGQDRGHRGVHRAGLRAAEQCHPRAGRGPSYR